jgi:acetyl-CoA carboxylase biotin carboxyl carrier protein
MDRDEIRAILDLMRENDLVEFELEQEGVKVRLKKAAPQPSSAPAGSAPVPPPGREVPPPDTSGQSAPLAPASEDVDLAIVKSPIVGTFYRASEPGAPPFVDLGEVVKKGQVLCIIEAMKLMNEINADCDGELVKVYVENGQAVHYGERLFAIRPS